MSPRCIERFYLDTFVCSLCDLELVRALRPFGSVLSVAAMVVPVSRGFMRQQWGIVYQYLSTFVYIAPSTIMFYTACTIHTRSMITLSRRPQCALSTGASRCSACYHPMGKACQEGLHIRRGTQERRLAARSLSG
ncbi:uncharacterized protein C8Q71DRAFT_734010 [Rhodofomes roseus]|uniref:Uncharacterized protein n=1 Tax=Rhodofomes roseus TaxID=34475 RepID=A0ABQ8KVJ7_9APHY|nr:uncharacterized protein C8Q71DRAFT_734010 [Rhodofomes roseus]KAH9842698.1 hypothetical protein C8Q71DRAFT_734010 [Rhodofomes roseus]